MFDMRILSVPRGKYNPYKHGDAFGPYESSPDVWVIQIRFGDNLKEWVSVPVIPYVDTEEK